MSFSYIWIKWMYIFRWLTQKYSNILLKQKIFSHQFFWSWIFIIASNYLSFNSTSTRWNTHQKYSVFLQIYLFEIVFQIKLFEYIHEGIDMSYSFWILISIKNYVNHWNFMEKIPLREGNQLIELCFVCCNQNNSRPNIFSEI